MLSGRYLPGRGLHAGRLTRLLLRPTQDGAELWYRLGEVLAGQSEAGREHVREELRVSHFDGVTAGAPVDP